MTRHGLLYATLTRAALHRRLSLSLRTLLISGGGLLMFASVSLVADNLFNLSPGFRLAVSAVFLGAFISTVVYLFWKYWRKPADSARMAVYLEQQFQIKDNSLINAVHFDRDSDFPVFLKDIFIASAESKCGRIMPARVWRHARLKPVALWCCAGMLVLLAYVIPFAPQAKNALIRFLNPGTSLTPLNFTQFELTPGDTEVVEGCSCLIKAEATKSGAPVSKLDIVIKENGAPLLYPMRADGEKFVFDMRDLTHTTRYFVRNGNDESRTFTVHVIPRPRLKSLLVAINPPAYTQAKSWRLDLSQHEVNVLKGSKVTIHTGVSGKREAFIYLGEKKARSRDKDVDFSLKADTNISIDVKDERGLLHTAVWQCRLNMVPDRTPTVRFLNRELNLEAQIGQSLPLMLEEKDDYGLSVLDIYTEENGQDQILKQLHYRDVKKDRAETTAFLIEEKIFARKGTYRVWARVFDNHVPPQAGIVPVPLTLHIVGPASDIDTSDKTDPYVRLFSLLAGTLESQKKLRDWTASRIKSNRKRPITPSVNHRQRDIDDRLKKTAELAAELFAAEEIRKPLNDGIHYVYQSLSRPLIEFIPNVAKMNDDDRPAGLNEIVLRQTDVIAAIQRLLGTASKLKAREDSADQRLAEEEQEQELIKKLETLKRDIEIFKDHQRKILADTEAIDKKDPEDWTEDEEKLLGDLAAKEQDFAKFFQAAFNDLSKLENQDFSNSTMADELVEMIEELQKSGESLAKKHTEIATLGESLLGEQAESIETNLERWLADAKDHVQWNGEESGLTPDVPLQDLPDELTDIVGDLIDSVEDMQDTEDSTNSSLSSFDEGMGWGVSDGNMDDMSAKGITGNIMPNNNEVGGRSGEGRSGKSSGQFVEQEAYGKGGRDTPTRLVQSPFEKGTVKDYSKDPQGGATGGGKQSGLGGEGLRGVTPDQKPDIQQRLPGNQVELRQNAEALLRGLSVRNLPTGDLEEAINKMEQIQKFSSTGGGLGVRQARSELLSNLKDARTAIQSAAAGGIERNETRNLRVSRIRHPENETTPPGYEDSVDAYFKALAE